MLRNNVPMRNVPRVELDQRAREARLRLERVERLLMPRPAVRHHWFRWLICIFGDRSFAGGRENRTEGSLSYCGPSFSFAS
jgi:hypothetical protein